MACQHFGTQVAGDRHDFVVAQVGVLEQPMYLNREQAAAILHVKPKTLANWASQGKGPRYRKAGGRVVLYTLGDLQAWVDERAN
ncbi:MAG: hypothetical protein RLZZ501_2055 [Pseudomonadota bacterium]|jgi:predicted DNA-binding transcriptional regulator AlpA